MIKWGGGITTGCSAYIGQEVKMAPLTQGTQSKNGTLLSETNAFTWPFNAENMLKPLFCASLKVEPMACAPFHLLLVTPLKGG